MEANKGMVRAPVIPSRRAPVVVFSPARIAAGGCPSPGLGVARPVECSCLAPGGVRVTQETGVPQITWDSGTFQVPHLTMSRLSTCLDYLIRSHLRVSSAAVDDVVNMI